MKNVVYNFSASCFTRMLKTGGGNGIGANISSTKMIDFRSKHTNFIEYFKLRTFLSWCFYACVLVKTLQKLHVFEFVVYIH